MFTPFLRRLFALASFVGLAACATVGPPKVVGLDAPKTSFALVEGGQLDLEGTRGDVVVLGFFASYCPMTPAILRAIDDLRARKANEGLTVIAVNEGDTTTNAEALANRLGLRLTLALDKDAVAARQLGLVTVPSIVVIDRDGTVRHVHSGYHGDVDRSAVESEVSALLEQSAAPTRADRTAHR